MRIRVKVLLYSFALLLFAVTAFARNRYIDDIIKDLDKPGYIENNLLQDLQDSRASGNISSRTRGIVEKLDKIINDHLAGVSDSSIKEFVENFKNEIQTESLDKRLAKLTEKKPFREKKEKKALLTRKAETSKAPRKRESSLEMSKEELVEFAEHAYEEYNRLFNENQYEASFKALRSAIRAATEASEASTVEKAKAALKVNIQIGYGKASNVFSAAVQQEGEKILDAARAAGFPVAQILTEIEQEYASRSPSSSSSSSSSSASSSAVPSGMATSTAGSPAAAGAAPAAQDQVVVHWKHEPNKSYGYSLTFKSKVPISNDTHLVDILGEIYLSDSKMNGANNYSFFRGDNLIAKRITTFPFYVFEQGYSENDPISKLGITDGRIEIVVKDAPEEEKKE